MSFKELSIPWFSEIYSIIDRVMVKCDHPFYLIGASAIAVELLRKGLKPSRGTKDIDFAVMLASLKEYEEVLTEMEMHGFQKANDIPHRLYHAQYDTVIDLLPFGQIEEQYTIRFSDRKTEIHVLGFSEVFESARKVQMEKITIVVPPLEGIVLLKLIAWGDRPDRRSDDLGDILYIFEKYFEHNYDEIVEYHYSTFPGEKDPFDTNLIGTEVIGRKIKKYLNRSTVLRNRIHALIDQSLEDPESSKLLIEWSRVLYRSLEYSASLLLALKKGLLNESEYDQESTAK